MLSSFSILNIVSVNRWWRIAIPPIKIIFSIVYHIIVSQYIIFSQLFFYFEYCLSQPLADNCWRERLFHREILTTGDNNGQDQPSGERFASIYKIYCKDDCRPFNVDKICLFFFQQKRVDFFNPAKSFLKQHRKKNLKNIVFP